MADTITIRDDVGTDEIKEGERVIRQASGPWPKGCSLEIRDYVSGRDLRRSEKFTVKMCEAEGIERTDSEADIISAQSLLAHVLVAVNGTFYHGPDLRTMQGSDQVQERFDAIDEGLPIYATTYAVGEITRLANGPLAPQTPAKRSPTA